MGTQRFTLTPAARRAIIVAGGWSIGALLVLAIAFAWGPFAANPPVIWSGVALGGLVHATVAALFVRWGFELGLWDVVTARRRALTVVALAAAAIATVVVVHFDRLILAELDEGYDLGFRGAAVAGVLVGVVFEASYLIHWVRRVDRGGAADPGRWDLLVPLTGGIRPGGVAKAPAFPARAGGRNAPPDPEFAAACPPLQGHHGVYYAFGDSYSAGEGLPPFDRWTAKVSAAGANRCHRSSRGYPRLLRFAEPPPPQVFTACSGAVIADIHEGHDQPGEDAVTFVAPQADGRVHPEAGLVTLTVGGNDLQFSRLVTFCVIEPDCMAATFGQGIEGGGRFVDYPGALPLDEWITETMDRVVERQEELFARLDREYPNARVLVLGYPYLFPGGAPPRGPSDCASVLRRVDEAEREAIRAHTDRFNGLTRDRALAAGLEFVSPVAVWEGHEPCGDAGQFTNAVKPIGGDGSFHPSRSGQEALAQLVSCYLASNPEPFEESGPAPGSAARPIPCPG